jgi:hypothetical protein
MQQLDLCDSSCSWTCAEIEAFETLLNSLWKDFDQIARQLPCKSVQEVVRFYYDVWKTQRLPQAVRWYQRKQQVGRLCEAQCDCHWAYI